MEFNYRLANLDDIPSIKELMLHSITKLLGYYVNEGELEASFESMGLDNQLIQDKTYFLIYFEGIFVGCGGWSNRKTLFGGNHTPNRSNDLLNPDEDAAKIRGIAIKSISRQITREDLEKFDFILTMDNENLSTVMSLAKELDSNLTKKIKPILSYANSSKLIEVPDPYYGGEQGFEKVLDLLEDGCKGLLKELSVRC